MFLYFLVTYTCCHDVEVYVLKEQSLDNEVEIQTLMEGSVEDSLLRRFRPESYRLIEYFMIKNIDRRFKKERDIEPAIL